MLLTKLNKLNTLLNTNNLDFKVIKKQLEDIKEYKEYNEYDYINNLLNPIKNKDVKIPSTIPIPTTTYRYHETLPIKTNNVGTKLIYVNPFFLGLKSCLQNPNPPVYSYTTRGSSYTRYIFFRYYITSYGESYLSSQNGKQPISDTSYQGFDNGLLFQLIEDCYSSYRLVSAESSLKYIGALENASGTIGGGISNDKVSYLRSKYYLRTQPVPATSFQPDNTYPDNILYKYGDFNTIRQLPYFRENSCIEGVRMLYYPKDNDALEFVPLFTIKDVILNQKSTTFTNPVIHFKPNTVKTGFNWIYFIENGVLGTNQYLFDITCNFECTVKAEYLEYIPTSTCYGAIPKNIQSEINKNKSNIVTKLIK